MPLSITKDGDALGQLKVATQEGIDAYFDNVGGKHLEAALSALRVHGRIIACGAISMYNDETPPPGPPNLPLMIGKRLTMKGFIVTDWLDHMPEFLKEVSGYLWEGKLTMKAAVEGIEGAPQAFLDKLHG